MIPIKNIYYMLAYAFRILDEKGYHDQSTEKFENTADVCAALLIKAISKQLKIGLEKEYISQKNELATLRGKIDISASIKEMSMQNKKMVCEYDEFSINCYMNQIIKTTVYFLIKNDISKSRKKELRKLMIYFQKVDLIEINTINWKLRFHRNNQNYRMMIGICYLVVKGLLQREEDGTKRLMSFLDDQKMCHLYEKFILEYYRKEFKDIKVSAEHIQWNLDNDFNNMLPTMKSDITLKYENRVLIIDAKYYKNMMQSQYDVNTIRSGHLYQIFTYVKNMDANSEEAIVSGMLLYAKTDEEIYYPEQAYQMSGNTIEVKTLDLNKDFNEIRKQLDDIVARYLKI